MIRWDTKYRTHQGHMSIRRFLPLFLTLFFLSTALYLVYHKPGAKKLREQPSPVISVRTAPILQTEYLVTINSFGRVEPHTQGQLVSQVSGQIILVSPNFRDGGFFKEGEVLVKVDPRDYRIQVDIAAAELAVAKVTYAEERVLAKQAAEDRKIVRNKGIVSDFALHIPQLAAAKSQIAAANAKLEQARLNVERTQIRAPYAGRMLTKNVDIGEVILANTGLASIYATDQVEIRLPVKNNELGFLKLPEQYASGEAPSHMLPSVKIGNRLGEDIQQWPAKLVRTAGAIDESSQQLYVIARIEHPYEKADSNRRPLKIGQYVTAEIEGRTIINALVIPNAAIYQGSYVYLFKDGVLERREIEIAWQNSREALIKKGLDAGDLLVLTPLGQVSSGTRVKMLGDEKEQALTGSELQNRDSAGKQSQNSRKSG